MEWIIIVCTYLVVILATAVFLGRQLKRISAHEARLSEETARRISEIDEAADEAKKKLNEQPKTLLAVMDSINALGAEVNLVDKTAQKALTYARRVQSTLAANERWGNADEEPEPEYTPPRVTRLPGRSG